MPATKNVLSNLYSLNMENVFLSKPNVMNIPNSKLTAKSVKVNVKNPDGSVGDLLIATEKVFSFGVCEDNGFDGDNKLNGYKLPLCLYDKDTPSVKEKEWVSQLDVLTDRLKQLVLDKKDELEKYSLEKADLKGMNSALYWKKEKGKIVEGVGPTFYVKLMTKKTADNGFDIKSKFYDLDTQGELDPKEIVGKYCYTRAVIKVESIFVGAKITIQFKVWEAHVSLLGASITKMLNPVSENNSSLLVQQEASPVVEKEESDFSDSDYEEEVAPVKSKKTTKRK